MQRSPPAQAIDAAQAYYQEAEGKAKKRDLNARRRKTPASPPPPPPPVQPAPLPWPRTILDYVCVLVGLIEGRRVELCEVVEMLRRTLRQHRMARARRIDQGVAWLHEQPP